MILALSALVPAQAARCFDTYAEASQKVSDTGYIVFIYPEGWDRYGEKLCRKLIADEKVLQAAGDAALLLAPIYQNRNEASNAKARSIMGSLGYPGDMSDISYPAIVFYEKVGRQYSTLHGSVLMKASAREVAEMISEKLQAKKQQDEILKKANATTDPGEKNRLYLESSRVPGIEWPGGLRDAMHKTDPGDKYGHLATLNFNFGRQKDEDMDSFLKRLDAVLADKRYSVNQKQRACAAAIGQIRRGMGMMAGGPLITKYARAMRKLDPGSPLGLSAPVVMRDWVRQYRYGQGWSPEILPGSEYPLRMVGVPVDKPGTYTVTFRIVTGRDAVHVKKVRLMEDSDCVAEDATARSVTWGATQQTFTLHVNKPVKSPELEITYTNDADHRSTWGEITVKRQ